MTVKVTKTVKTHFLMSLNNNLITLVQSYLHYCPHFMTLTFLVHAPVVRDEQMCVCTHEKFPSPKKKSYTAFVVLSQ